MLWKQVIVVKWTLFRVIRQGVGVVHHPVGFMSQQWPIRTTLSFTYVKEKTKAHTNSVPKSLQLKWCHEARTIRNEFSETEWWIANISEKTSQNFEMPPKLSHIISSLPWRLGRMTPYTYSTHNVVNVLYSESCLYTVCFKICCFYQQNILASQKCWLCSTIAVTLCVTWLILIMFYCVSRILFVEMEPILVTSYCWHNKCIFIRCFFKFKILTLLANKCSGVKSAIFLSEVFKVPCFTQFFIWHFDI